MKKLEDGFFSISGATVDAAGTLYFVDHHQQRIFSWSAPRGLVVVRDAPLDPVNLAVAKSGDVLVVSSAGPEGTVYTFNPAKPADELTVLEPQPAAPRPDAAVVLPVNVWVNGEFEDQLDPATYEYVTLAQLFAQGRRHAGAAPVRVARTAAWCCRPDASSSSPASTPTPAWTKPAGAGRTTSTPTAC